MSDNKVPLVVPLNRWKHSEKKTLDSAPILWKEPSSKHPKTETKQSACKICKQNLSRYTCPRCQIPYCSVNCYRNHSSTDSEEASACTEAFYQNRVESILQLETREHSEGAQKLLNRQYEQSLASDPEDISTDELYTLLSVLEGQQSEDSLSQEQLLSLLSPTLRANFQKDLQNGALQSFVLESWYPWWRRELGKGNDVVGDNGESSVTAIEGTRAKKSLDERLLKVPSFHSIRRSGPAPQLLFNAVDIVYSICWTLRLYHGANNAASQLALDAAMTLIYNSKVLKEDERYDHLEQVLISSTAASTRQYPAGCNVHWTVLTTDCSLVLASSRLVGRAMLEAIDILKAALRNLKQEEGSDDSIQQASQLRRVRKKLEFFLSWSKQSSELGEDIKNAIQGWAECWRPEFDAEEFIEEVQLPVDDREGAFQQHKSTVTLDRPPTKPLLTVVGTKLK
eukprot:scaffold9191_cov114-Cylindrotheca_fusiformis.AAC.21